MKELPANPEWIINKDVIIPRIGISTVTEIFPILAIVKSPVLKIESNYRQLSDEVD
jgi:hypothetical protein